jgi:RNA-dependent RNA polymerase
MIRRALQEHNIEVKPMPDFELQTERKAAVWDYIDSKPKSSGRKPRTAIDYLGEDDAMPLSYVVRYQLEVCISEGWLNEHNITEEFVAKLRSMEEVKAKELLEYVSYQKKRVFDPMTILKLRLVERTVSRLRIPSYCTYVRSANITPSTIYFNTPTVETSNRVIRHYAEYSDRFLRVRFTDEKSQVGPVYLYFIVCPDVVGKNICNRK